MKLSKFYIFCYMFLQLPHALTKHETLRGSLFASARLASPSQTLVRYLSNYKKMLTVTLAHLRIHTWNI